MDQVILKTKAKTTNLLEEKIGEKLDLYFGMVMTFSIPKTQSMRVEIDKLDFIKIKNFCCAKDNYQEK